MQITLAKTTAWNFATNTEGWLPANSITGSVSNGIYTLNITGSEPFMMSPANLNLDAGSFFQVNFLIQNKTADPDFRLYFITSNDPTWNDAKSIGFKVNTNQTAYTDVEAVMVKNTAWTGCSYFRLPTSAFTINISSLTPGLYFIKLINQQITYTQKFIKQ